MAQNYLYMFEFVVDDVLITRPNDCAPEEYPMCCEITFRSSVFVSICDRDFGGCADPCERKCGKCCLFSLESKITKNDRLHIHVYKKKTDKCKFLLGTTEIPIKQLFDKVTSDFCENNPNMDNLDDYCPPQKGTSRKSSDPTVVDNDCDDRPPTRKEQTCPSSELTKRLLSLFNLKGCQTGNIVLIMRLVCNGPAIVSTFPFGKCCSCGSKSGCGPICKKKKCKICPGVGCGRMEDPCKKEEPKGLECRRYFNTSGCSCSCKCSECEERDECPVCNGDPCICKEQCSEISMHPCLVCPTKPNPGPEAYDEFEANLNGSGLVIRVLKDNHQVQSIEDGDDDNCCEDSCSECDVQKIPSRNSMATCESISQLMQKNRFVKNHIERRTGGRITNHPKIPPIRANIKYSGNDSCCGSYQVPFSKMKQHCEKQQQKIESYRRIQPKDASIRNCCFQVLPTDIDATLRGINGNTKKKGIEVCYKACEDSNTDTFLVKLGKKQRCQNRKNMIEIELKTPKEPIILQKQTVTTETQIDEADLDDAMKKASSKSSRRRKNRKNKQKKK